MDFIYDKQLTTIDEKLFGQLHQRTGRKKCCLRATLFAKNAAYAQHFSAVQSSYPPYCNEPESLIEDGLAVERFLKWLEDSVAAAGYCISHFQAGITLMGSPS